MKLDDREIINGIKKCDSKVLKFIYTNYFPSIRQFIINNNGKLDDARDVFQDAMNVVFEKVRKNELELNASFGTYLFSIIKNIWFAELRRKKVQNLILGDLSENEEVEADVIPEITKSERQKLYLKHLDNLSHECRKVLDLMANEAQNREIQVQMGYSSEQYVKNRKAKCFERLMEKITGDPTFKELKNEKR